MVRLLLPHSFSISIILIVTIIIILIVIKIEIPTPQVIVLHREYTQGGSIGVTLAGGADYESKEITVTIISCSSIHYIILYDRLGEKLKLFIVLRCTK